jgi:hypothetical protein
VRARAFFAYIDSILRIYSFELSEILMDLGGTAHTEYLALKEIFSYYFRRRMHL